MRGALESGEVTAVGLCEAVLERVSCLEPRLNAVADVLEDAITAAERADQRRLDGEQGWLLGVPLGLKDDLDVAGYRTGYGTSARNVVADTSTEIVARAVQKGAVPVIKTRVPEFDQWPFTESSVGGVTTNPWDFNRTPGGSSGGSAAAVAAGMVPAAIGSDGGGSVRIPAACCGIVGYKPSRGFFPTAPARDIWQGLGTYGTLTRSVLDAAILADALGGPGVDDHFRLESVPAGFEAATREAHLLSGLCIAVSVRPSVRVAKVDTVISGFVAMAASLLEKAGHHVYDDLRSWPDPMAVLTLRSQVGLLSASRYASSSEVDRATRTARRIAKMHAGISPSVAAWHAKRVATHANEIFEHADFVLTPTIGTLPPLAGTVYKASLAAAAWHSRWALPYTPLWNVAGNPAVSLPIGLSEEGLPVSVQLIGAVGDDARLLALASQLEKATGWSHRPSAA
ncbi:amidase family protein [Mycobacteroides stephanolepidis]|nr:amidase family protein [[Mycobacterium] stephanolepidis]